MLYFAATIPTALYTALSCTDPCNLRHSSLRFLGRTCSQQCRYSFHGGVERPLSMPRADRMGMDGVQIVCEGCGARLPHQSRGTKAFFCLCAFQMSCV